MLRFEFCYRITLLELFFCDYILFFFTRGDVEMSHQNKITTHTHEKINDYMRFQQQTTVYAYIAGSK